MDQGGGLLPGRSREVARETGVPEAHVHGVASFYHLTANPEIKIRVCDGLSCWMNGSHEVLAKAKAMGLPVDRASCLAACDKPPAVMQDRWVYPSLTVDDIERAGNDWRDVKPQDIADDEVWKGVIGPTDLPEDQLAMNLHLEHDYSGAAFRRAAQLGAEEMITQIRGSGLQGRGGAGFPAHIKWSGVHKHGPERTKYVVLNADEGEPGTFKDREVMLRRPDLILEGLAIAAQAVGSTEVYLYLRGEFQGPWQVMEDAIARFARDKVFGDINFHMHAGHGAYICGEETALLEALEGKRGMPRLKPPYPTDRGLWGEPTLMHNVETIACVPPIVMRGGEWFRALGREEAGSKLYSISGHVHAPGIYEVPLGVTLDELVELAGGYVGELKAFSPGGASSGFLPASSRNVPLDYKSLKDAGSMLGSAGVVVLNDTVNMRDAVMSQLVFFEAESCGQCAPCRIGTRFLREGLERYEADQATAHLAQVADAAWQMNEGSICGLGMTAALPLTTAMKYFPEEFGND
jgi:NADH:ubiquinone oxidoreductase subunit F (NADH-binding)